MDLTVALERLGESLGRDPFVSEETKTAAQALVEAARDQIEQDRRFAIALRAEADDAQQHLYRG